MLTYTYISKGKFGLVEKPKPTIQHERDAIVKVTLASICSSDLHIKHGSVPRAVEGITVGHEMVGIVEESVLCAAPSAWYLIAGAVANTVLFLAVSIPMADKRQSRKDGFAEYKKQTRMLLPIKK